MRHRSRGGQGPLGQWLRRQDIYDTRGKKKVRMSCDSEAAAEVAGAKTQCTLSLCSVTETPSSCRW